MCLTLLSVWGRLMTRCIFVRVGIGLLRKYLCKWIRHTRCFLIWSASLLSSLSCSSYSMRRPVGFRNRFWRASISVSSSLFCCSSDRTFGDRRTHKLWPLCASATCSIMLDAQRSARNALLCFRSQKAHLDTASLCRTLKWKQIRQILSKMGLENMSRFQENQIGYELVTEFKYLWVWVFGGSVWFQEYPESQYSTIVLFRGGYRRTLITNVV